MSTPVQKISVTPFASHRSSAATSRPKTSGSINIEWIEKTGGLEQLSEIDYLQITQNMKEDRAKSNCCTRQNTYKVLDRNGKELFHVAEATSCCCRFFCGPHRSFEMVVYTMDGNTALRFVRRACRFDGIFCFMRCCMHRLDVEDGNGQLIGYVQERWSPFSLKLNIVEADESVPVSLAKETEVEEDEEKDEEKGEKKPACYQCRRGRIHEEERTLFKVRSPCCPCRCNREMEFDFYSKNLRRRVGQVNKHWLGPQKVQNLDHDNFDVILNKEIGTKEKSLLLGAAFLVNYLFFEMS